MKRSRWDELVSLAPTPGSVSGIDDELLVLVPELIPTRTTPQSPVYHGEGDVWTHTKMVLKGLVTGDDYGRASSPDRAVLFAACLLHDIAKPSTTVIDPDGRIRQPGHSKRGSIDARALLWAMGAPFEVRERIASVILHHQDPFFGIGEQRGLSGEFRLIRMSWRTRITDLIAVARADIKGRIAADIPRILDEIAILELAAQDLGCLDSPFVFPDAVTRLAYFRRRGEISPRFAFFEEDGPLVTFVCGLPGSGKDHWIAHHGDGQAVVSFDDVRADMDVSHGDAEGQVAQAAKELVRVQLRKQEPFIWNATALQRTFRDPRIDLVRAYRGRVRIVHVEAESATTWKRQNRERPNSVPEAYLDRALQRWELPLGDEAHAVTYVRQGMEVAYLV